MTEKSNVAKANRSGIITIILAFIAIILCMLIWYFWTQSSSIGREAAKNAYIQAKEETADKVYDQFYQAAYSYAEKANHVSNVASISIEKVRKIGKLEVLSVNDQVYIISEEKDNNSGASVWISVPGQAVFTVDLEGAEYIIDSDRQYVLVRVPAPVLNLDTIKLGEAEKLLFEEGAFSSKSSVGTGEELGQNILREARSTIQIEMESNQEYFQLAKNAATRLIISYVKAFNQGIEGLTVEVEFYD